MNTSISSEVSVRDEREYHEYLSRIQSRFETLHLGTELFSTDVEDLFEAFLDGLSPDDRQHYTCNSCRRFVNRFGGIVQIDSEGVAHSPFWNPDDAPAELRGAVTAVLAKVLKSKVTGVFLCSEPVWGTPITKEWHHMAFVPGKSLVFNKATMTAFQASAEKKEDYKNVMTALTEFTLPQIQQSILLLDTDALYRSEKCLGVAKWLKRMHEIREIKNHTTRTNLFWVEIAKAPAGFCHPRASMIGTLLEDIAAGLPMEDVSRRFAAKMHPLQYQRPQAAPSAGNIAQAEKVIAQLQAAGSLGRRFARLDEIQSLWTPRESPVKPQHSGGVFSHLTPKEQLPAAQPLVPSVTMTWEKFSRTVLPIATKIEFQVPGHGNFAGLVTAENPDAPPIIQWDRDEQRNPVSWYLYNSGSSASKWGLSAGTYCKVNAVCLQPSMWFDSNAEHQGQGVLFVLDGAKDTRTPGTGLALFPEILKAEFHGIRATIEAFSRRGELSGTEEASANGIMCQKNSRSDWNSVFRVTTVDGIVQYKLDRWD